MTHIKISMMHPILQNEEEFMTMQFNTLQVKTKIIKNSREGQKDKVIVPYTCILNSLYNP